VLEASPGVGETTKSSLGCSKRGIVELEKGYVKILRFKVKIY
jgi:hypothetical protein